VIRPLVAIGVLAWSVPIAAQANATEARSALMKEQSKYAWRGLNGMVRGQVPYDQAKVDEALAKLSETSAKLSSLFPESSKGKAAADSKYFSKDAVWENKSDFDARIVKLEKDVAELKTKVRSLEDLKAAYPMLSQNCDSCHEKYRGRKS